MGEPVIYCPLCCNDTFKSRQDLFDHLFQISSNLNCPVCSEKFSSLEHLIGHIKDDDCVFVNPVETLFEDDTLETNKKFLDDSNIKLFLRTNDVKINNKNLENHISSINANNGVKLSNDKESGVEKMYVEVQLMKQCHDTQEIKLVKEDGQERYVIYTEDPNLNSDVTIVTKQNNDGTISLTTMKDTSDTSDADGTLVDKIHSLEDLENELETESKNQEEVYSCNTCGVSFSSVLEHIQNYHNNQDVVVEEPCEDSDSNIPIEYKSAATEEVCDKQTSRRMITDTGDIIEAPLVQDNKMVENHLMISLKDEPQDKQDQRYTMRYVQSEKFSNSMTKEIKPIDGNNDKLLNYHKVVLKELQTTSGDVIKVYNCMSCNVYVSSLSEFKQHPCKVLKYSCPECPIAYENSKSLCAHMKVHKIKSTEVLYEAPKKFECEICGTIFQTSKSLKLHKRMHDPIKARPIEPPVETPEGMAASDDKYVCSICDKLIPIDYRAIHQNSHKSSNKMNCDICNKKFHSQEYLDMHMSVHNMDKVTVGKKDKFFVSLPYMCLYCNRKFARPHEKVKHERIHTGEKPHECEICGKAFRVSYCLTLHMRTHTGARPYACPHCNKRFKAHSVYNHHLLTHSEVRAYKCPFCPKAFKTSVQLAGHKNSHTKPFSCQHCNRPFASLYAVRVHMEIHSRQNSLKFSCNMCGASYARAFALKDHVKQVHKQDMDNTDNLVELKDAWIVE